MIYLKSELIIRIFNVIARQSAGLARLTLVGQARSKATKQSHDYERLTENTRLPRPAEAGLAKTTLHR